MKTQQVIGIVYKGLAVGLILFAIIAGLWMPVPDLPLLGHSWRNLFFHVPMWYVLLILLFVSGFQSIKLLQTSDLRHDAKASENARVGLLFGMLGLITGAVWSRVTWNAAMASTDPAAWWAWDPKQVAAAFLLLIYFGYFVLRQSFDEPLRKAKMSAVFNIFGAAMIIPLFYIVPQMVESMHPGAEGDGNFSALVSLTKNQRAIFYPASLGFILLGIWITELRVRMKLIEEKIEESL